MTSKHWHTRKNDPAWLARSYPFGPHHAIEAREGLAAIGKVLPPADILVDVGAAFGHASQAVVDAGGLIPGGRRIHVDHNPAFAEDARACGADFMSLDLLRYSVHASQGQIITVVVSHLVNQSDSEEEKSYLDKCLLDLYRWMVGLTVCEARVFVVALEPGQSRRAAGFTTNIDPSAWVAKRNWRASPANRTKIGGTPKSFVITELRSPSAIWLGAVSPEDFSAKVEDLPLGFGCVSHDPIPITPFIISRAATGGKELYGLAPEDVEEFMDATENRREAYLSQVSHDFDMLGKYGDEW